MTNNPGLTQILLGLCGVFALANAAEWGYLRYGIAESRKSIDQPIEADVNFEAIGGHEFTLAPKQSFSDFVERPLMIEGRRPLPEEPEAPLAVAQVNLGELNVKLMGIVVAPDKKTAVFIDGKGAYQRLGKDGIIDGWELEGMKSDRVVLVQGGERREVRVWKPKPKTPPPNLQQKVQDLREKMNPGGPRTLPKIPRKPLGSNKFN